MTAQNSATPASTLRETLFDAEREIIRLKHRYWRACDSKDPESFRSCFVREGGTLDYGPLGRMDPDAMAGLFAKIALATLPDGSPQILDMHHGFMPTIDIDIPTDGVVPTRARGRWTLHFRQVDRGASTETIATGEYDDDYLLEDGRWVMLRCDFIPGWSITRPLGDASIQVV